MSAQFATEQSYELLAKSSRISEAALMSVERTFYGKETCQDEELQTPNKVILRTLFSQQRTQSSSLERQGT